MKTASVALLTMSHNHRHAKRLNFDTSGFFGGSKIDTKNNVICNKTFMVTSLIIIKFYTFGAQIDNFVPCNLFWD